MGRGGGGAPRGARLLCAGEVVLHGEADREREVVQLLAHVGHEIRLVDRHAQHLALPVDADDAARGLVRRRHEDRLGGDAVHIDQRRGLEVVDVQVAELGWREGRDAGLGLGRFMKGSRRSGGEAAARAFVTM